MKIRSQKKGAENTYFRMPKHVERLLVKRHCFLHAALPSCEMTDYKKKKKMGTPKHQLDNDFNLISKYW